MSERFRRSWRGWTESSEGYSVRLLGRTKLEFRDSAGTIRISAEAMSKPWNEIVVYVQSIPDTTIRPRAEVLDRLQRAFRSRGWTMVESPD
jgi:pyruvate dehydrogenase complex dehydrogenase (E1) component